MERSDLPTADTSRTPPHLHQARHRRRFPACAVPATAPHQRASGPRDASAGSGSRAIRRGAAWRPCAGEPGPAAAARGTAAPARRGGTPPSPLWEADGSGKGAAVP